MDSRHQWAQPHSGHHWASLCPEHLYHQAADTGHHWALHIPTGHGAPPGIPTKHLTSLTHWLANLEINIRQCIRKTIKFNLINPAKYHLHSPLLQSTAWGLSILAITFLSLPLPPVLFFAHYPAWRCLQDQHTTTCTLKSWLYFL